MRDFSRRGVVKVCFVDGLSDDVSLRRTLPDAVFAGVVRHDHEVAFDIARFAEFLILLHQIDIEFGLFLDLYSELWVIEPPICTYLV